MERPHRDVRGEVERWGEPAAVADELGRLVALVRASPHNLLSPRGLDELETRHVPECLALAHRLPEGPAHVLDVGSGGGFPGLVIAIARPDLEVSLIEATTKKAQFLSDTASELGLRVDVHNDRAEHLVGSLGARFDLVTARAVAPLERLLEWTVPFLRPGGALYAVKGERWAAELAQARPALQRLGCEVLSVPEEGRVASDDDPRDPRVVIIGARA